MKRPIHNTQVSHQKPNCPRKSWPSKLDTSSATKTAHEQFGLAGSGSTVPWAMWPQPPWTNCPLSCAPLVLTARPNFPWEVCGVSIFSILPTLLVSILSVLPALIVGIYQLCLQVNILLTLVVSARAATGWLVGSCRPHVARDGARTTISQKIITINHEQIFPRKWLQLTLKKIPTNILHNTPGIKYGTLLAPKVLLDSQQPMITIQPIRPSDI